MILKPQKRARAFAIAAFWLLATNCGVEVGNPHKGNSVNQGALSLALADAPLDGAQHVYLNVVGLAVIPQNADGSRGTPLQVPLAASGKIDALALSDGKALSLTASTNLPAGAYRSVVLELDPNEPATVVDANGGEKALALPHAHHGIAVSQGFQVVNNQTLNLVLHLDLRRSISRQDGDPNHPYAFQPFANLGRHEDEGKIIGSVAETDVNQVCAYMRLHDHDGDAQRGLTPPGPPPDAQAAQPDSAGVPSDSVTAEPPPRFDSDAQIDTTGDDASCAHAFMTAAVTSGAFTLAHLWPGDYKLVYFKADGTRLSQSPQEVEMQPGQMATIVGPAGP